MKINSYYGWLKTALHRLQCIFVILWISATLDLRRLHRKISIISPGAYFWSKGLFAKFFFEKAIFFVQAIVIF